MTGTIERLELRFAPVPGACCHMCIHIDVCTGRCPKHDNKWCQYCSWLVDTPCEEEAAKLWS